MATRRKPPRPPDAGYSIRVVSRLTGISADNLRMWERRYGYPSPARNDAGVRMYTAGDVERLMLIDRGMRAGYRAGEVIRKPPAELERLLSKARDMLEGSATTPPEVQPFFQALENEDAPALRRILRRAAASRGPERFVHEVAEPLIHRVGHLWAMGKIQIRHEHLLAEALTTELNVLRAGYDEALDGPIILLATLPGERHRLGLEMAALFFVTKGAAIRFLGSDTPPDQIAEAALALHVHAIALSISEHSDHESTVENVKLVLSKLRYPLPIWAGGRGAPKLAERIPEVSCTATWSDAHGALAELKSRVSP